MKWENLYKITGMSITSAVLVIFLMPIAADILLNMGIDYALLKIPILGGLIYMIGFSIFKLFIPKTILDHPIKSNFKDFLVIKNANIFDELTSVNKLNAKTIIDLLGNDSSIFYPPEKGLIYARSECIRRYADIEYDIINSSNMPLRIIISILIFISILMINWLMIERLFRVLWS